MGLGQEDHDTICDWQFQDQFEAESRMSDMAKKKSKVTKKSRVKVTKKSRTTKTRSRTTAVGGLPTQKSRRAVELKDYMSVWFGQPGVGKTTFVNDFGRVLFLSTDRGTRFMDAMAWPCHAWSDFEKVLTLLKKNNAADYDFVCIDHVADWGYLAELDVLDKLGIDALADAGYGKGWSELKKKLNRFVQELMRLDVGLVFIAHQTTSKIKKRGIEHDEIRPMMSKQCWEIVVGTADLVGYCTTIAVKDRKTKKRKEIRVFEAEPYEGLFVKDRTQRKRPAASYEPLDGRKFIATFS